MEPKKKVVTPACQATPLLGTSYQNVTADRNDKLQAQARSDAVLYRLVLKRLCSLSKVANMPLKAKTRHSMDTSI